MRTLRRSSHARARAAVLAGLASLAVIGGCTATTSGHGAGVTTGSSHSSGVGSPSPGRSGSTGGPAGPPQPAAKFSDCSDRFNLGSLTFPGGRRDRLTVTCAGIEVPLDYADTSGRTVTLQLVKVHDRANTAHVGSLLVNPGGPGGSGVDLALGLSAELSDTLLAHFDVIGFDPRGVGASTPVRCLTDKQKDDLNAFSPDVRTATGFTQARARAAQVARLCTSKYGTALAKFDTVQTARDLDQIRQAVGDDRLNYLGFSYGTELGAQYAHLFPDRIRVMVLDGAVDPLTSDITAFADQLRGFEGAFDQFATWCTSHSPCSSLGDARAAVYRIAAAARRTPIPSEAAGETRTATSALVDTGVLSALYSQSRWPTLGEALIQAGGNDSQGLLSLADDYNERYDGRYTNLSDANLTISCNDSKPGPTDPTIRATTRSWVTRFPMFGLWSAASLFSCQQWQPERAVPPLPTAPTTQRKVLVIGNLHDPATPYQGAKDLARTLGNAELLTWDGEGHTSYLQGSRCIDDYVNAYLVAGTLPPAGKTCPR
jgi:pimeloyl-ACP methyl ester carboxylesterase